MSNTMKVNSYGEEIFSPASPPSLLCPKGSPESITYRKLEGVISTMATITTTSPALKPQYSEGDSYKRGLCRYF